VGGLRDGFLSSRNLGDAWYPSQAIVVAREIAAEHERADIDAAVRDWTGL